MSDNKIKIGSRGSQLALWQANHLRSGLNEIGVESDIKIIKTKGDKLQHLSFDKIEGKGFFTKEIEDALLREDVDIAVHSMKDLPTTSPEGQVITALSYREDPRDCLVIRKECVDKESLFSLPNGAVVGTSSVRRKAQLLSFRQDIVLKDIRGNVPTRLKKLDSGDYDALMLAAAGLIRLQIDLAGYEVVKLNPREFIPAPAQGILAYQTRESDLETRRLLKQIHHSDVAALSNIERKVLSLMDGGCQLPLGVYCERDNMDNYHLLAAYAKRPGAAMRRVRYSSSTTFGMAEKVVADLKKEDATLD